MQVVEQGWGSNYTTMDIPLIVEEGNEVAFASTLDRRIPGDLGNLQLPVSPSLIVSGDLVEGLEGHK